MELERLSAMEGVEGAGGVLGDLLTRAREARHLTRDALGDIFGVEALVITHWESSGASPEVQPILERWIAHRAGPSGEECAVCRAAADAIKAQHLPISVCRSVIRRRIERSVASRVDAEDVVQATFVKLARSGYNDSVPIKLAYDVARKSLFSFLKKKALRAESETFIEIDAGDPSSIDEAAIVRRIFLKESQQLLAELMAVLNKNQRGVAELWLDGLGHAEISQALGITQEQSREYLRQTQNKWKKWRDDPRCTDLRDALGGVILFDLDCDAVTPLRKAARAVWSHGSVMLLGGAFVACVIVWACGVFRVHAIGSEQKTAAARATNMVPSFSSPTDFSASAPSSQLDGQLYHDHEKMLKKVDRDSKIESRRPMSSADSKFPRAAPVSGPGPREKGEGGKPRSPFLF